MTQSLLCALMGWLTCIVGFTIRFSDHASSSSLLGVAFVVAFFSGGVILLVWLCLLWPLYHFVPFPSFLWHPVVCPLCGAVAGAAIWWLALSAMFNDWSTQGSWGEPMLYISALVGAVTCAAGFFLKRSDHPRPDHALQRTLASSRR